MASAIPPIAREAGLEPGGSAKRATPEITVLEVLVHLNGVLSEEGEFWALKDASFEIRSNAAPASEA